MWLADVMEGHAPGAGDIVDVDVEIIGHDRGFTGVVARIAPRYSRPVEGAPASLVAKFPLAERAGNTSYRDHVVASPELARGYAERGAREVHFYAVAGKMFSQIPNFYFGHADVDAGEVMLLLEDLLDAEPGDALGGCSVSGARSVLSGLVELHGRWWQDPKLPAMDWLSDWSATIPGRADRFRQQSAVVIERYRDRLDPATLELISNLSDCYQRIIEDLASAPTTLAHGDLHLDNVMFMPDPDGPVAYIIDWQAVTRGPVLLDVAGFVAESLSVEDRRAHEIGLLHEYHDGLQRAGVAGYPFERLYEDYLRALIVRLAGGLGWLARVHIDDLEGRVRALVEAFLEPGNVFTAAVDHDIMRRLGLT